MSINKNLNKLCSILLAKSIIDLYPSVILGDSAINEDGFSYSFLLDKPFSIKEFPKLLKQIKKNIDRSYEISYETISHDEAKKVFSNQKYKLELIANHKTVDIIRFGKDFVDLSENLAISKLSSIKALDLMEVSGVYWQNDAKNAQLSSISGCAFDSQNALDEFKAQLIDRKERDHRKIGNDLDLFSFDLLAGQGLPIWLPKGSAIKYEIDAYVHNLLQKNGYKFVNSPILGSKSLYETSGHWIHYRDNMFPALTIDEDVHVLRPMTCPHHLLVYKQKPRSYRELPFRVAEHAILHRYESSGSLTGLERVRSMQLIDTHIICTNEQIKEVVARCYKIINEANDTFGVKVHAIDLSLHDKDDKNKKFFENEALWEKAENNLRKVLDDLSIKYHEQKGEAAFYGPKIDLQVKTALGKIITAYTIQLDFLLPEKFDLQYKDKNGEFQRPVLIHASVIGTLERFMSILLEQNKGVFPLWLSPIQVAIIPVDSIKHGVYCEKINMELLNDLVRCEFDNSDERLSKKIRDAQVQKIPYQLIIGDNEIKNNTISYREYGKQDSHEVSLNEFKNIIKSRIAKHE